MASKHKEVLPPHSERGKIRLNERFDSLAHVLVVGLRVNKETDGITIATNRKGASLILNSDGTFSVAVSDESNPQVILNGATISDAVTAETLLPVYAKLMHADEIIRGVSETTASKLRAYEGMSLAREHYQDLVARVLEPFVIRYVKEHEVSLMQNLVGDMIKAYGPTLRVANSLEA